MGANREELDLIPSANIHCYVYAGLDWPDGRTRYVRSSVRPSVCYQLVNAIL